MDFGSIASFTLLTFVVSIFTIGLLSNVFFLAFLEENDKLNKETQLD